MREFRTLGSVRGAARKGRPYRDLYGAFYRSELYSLAFHIDQHLVRWAMKKFKRLRDKPTKAGDWLEKVRQYEPKLFAHWHMVPRTNNRPVGAG